MDTNDEEEDDDQNYQLITTDDGENDETENPNDLAKTSPSAAA